MCYFIKALEIPFDCGSIERTAGSAARLDTYVREVLPTTQFTISSFVSTFFYVGAVFCAGLLVDRDDPDLTNSANSGTVASSPFVIAFKKAGMHWVCFSPCSLAITASR